MNNNPSSPTGQILAHALRYCTPCQSHEAVLCAIVPATPFVQDILPIRSILFRDWLIDTFHREHEIFPSASALRHAIKLFEAKARHSEFPRQSLALRTSHHGDSLNPTAILLDLANHDGDSVHITQEGWQITTTHQSFRRSPSHSRHQSPAPSPQPQFHQRRQRGYSQRSDQQAPTPSSSLKAPPAAAKPSSPASSAP